MFVYLTFYIYILQMQIAKVCMRLIHLQSNIYKPIGCKTNK